jgi:3,4-dehydroadipyl-CoA semialdehyde dehydrogenase
MYPAMETLRSHVAGSWTDAGPDTSYTDLYDPSTEQVIARVASGGLDTTALLDAARRTGGPALRALTFSERGEMLRGLSKVLRDNRDELLELCRVNMGTTVADGAFDVDGGSFTLGWYGKLAAGLGATHVLPDGEGVQLAKTDAFYGRHMLVPRQGVAVHINAFNFPVWGFAEKLACAIAAGMPVITKPATSTAWPAVRALELLLESGILPAGALQVVVGSTGDLLDRLGPQDVVAFTGSADTALKLRSREALMAANARFNTEADSLNAAVLAPDVTGGAAFDLFVKDVTREITQKAGQKCTAVRRILAPASAMDTVQDALVARLGRTVVGNPADESVRMGPLASAQQLESALSGIAQLSAEARIVFGTGDRADGVGAEPGRGYFVAPTLLRTDEARNAAAVHRHEVFGPVATLVSYDGTGADAAAITALGHGTLVTSVYSNDDDWLRDFVVAGGSSTGRLYIGGDASAGEAPGSGVAMPQMLHGGPGRAGGGEELGGLVGMRLYMQRFAVQGARSVVDKLTTSDSDS